jgi:hypothetical protein
MWTTIFGPGKDSKKEPLLSSSKDNIPLVKEDDMFVEVLKPGSTTLSRSASDSYLTTVKSAPSPTDTPSTLHIINTAESISSSFRDVPIGVTENISLENINGSTSSDNTVKSVDLIKSFVGDGASIDDKELTQLLDTAFKLSQLENQHNMPILDKQSEPEPEDKWTEEYINSLSVSTIIDEFNDLNNGRKKVPITYATFKDIAGPLKNLTGEYCRITFTDDCRGWKGYVGGVKKGWFHGIGMLFSHDKVSKLGVWIKNRDLIKGEYNYGNFIDSGAFYTDEQFKIFLNDPNGNRKFTNDEGVFAEKTGEFIKGTFIEGITEICQLITWEGKPAIMSNKGKEDDLCSIKMLNSDTTFYLRLDNIYPDGSFDCKSMDKIMFADGCAIKPVYQNARPTLIDNEIVRMNGFQFVFSNDFNEEMFEKWDPLIFKYYLMVTFKDFSPTFFSNFMKYVPDRQILHSLEEKHYVDIGLKSVEYLRMKLHLEQMFSL